jgi:hypothetical protein
LPALIYIVGYAPVRFALELVRGDWARPHRWGLSEAQWAAPATAIAARKRSKIRGPICAAGSPRWNAVHVLMAA